MSVLHDAVWAGIEFQRDVPAAEKLVLNGSILDLGKVTNQDGARLL